MSMLSCGVLTWLTDMRLMYMEELKILFGEFVSLTLALNVPSRRSWSMPCCGLGPTLLIWFVYSVSHYPFPNVSCLGTSGGSTLRTQDGQSPCFKLRCLAPQLPGATTWVLLSSCSSRYTFIGNNSCGIQNTYRHQEGMGCETMSRHLNSQRYFPSLLTPFLQAFMRWPSCKTANYDVKTLQHLVRKHCNEWLYAEGLKLNKVMVVICLCET